MPLVALGSLCALSSCSLERLFGADMVGAGVARLSVSNMSVLTNIISNDTSCGFESESVKDAAIASGELGARGTVTTKVEGCRLQFDAPTEVDRDCNDVAYHAKGTAIISGTRVITGIITGNPASPIIPDGPAAVAIELAADFTDFSITVSNSPNIMTIKKGSTSFTALPHLAQSASLGVCAIPTRDIALQNVQWKAGGKAFIVTPDRSFDVDVNGSKIDAQVGKYDGVENMIAGSVLVWDHNTPLPPKDDPVLDPDYDAKVASDSYQCAKDIKTPSEYVCLDIKPQLAQGAAALTVANVGNLISLLSADTRCGFKSVEGMKPVGDVTGAVGKDGGEVVYRVNECVLDFPAPHVVSTDCNGLTNSVTGKATVSAEMHLKGIRSGDDAEPIVPTSRTPAEIRFRVTFDNYVVTNSANDQSLQIVDGTLSGRMVPRMAIDALTGACSIATPNVTFSDLAYDRASAVLTSAGNHFKLALGVSSLEAQNGTTEGRTNYLAGTLFVDGTNYTIPVNGGAPELDPTFDEATFETAYACTPHMLAAPDEEDCSFKRVLGENAARLLVQTTGTVASLVNADTNCGIENTLRKLRPSDVQGSSGQIGSMTWRVEDCHVGAEAPLLTETDCTGGQTYVDGFAGVDAVRVVTGEREKKFLIVDSIIPRDREAVEIQLHGVTLDELSSYSIPAGALEPKGVLTLHNGTLNANVHPVLGERASALGTFDVPTPIARIGDVVALNADATLSAQGKTFHFHIDRSNISAVNGTYHGDSNHIIGDITVDGVTIAIDAPLNPDFAQATFDAGYQCTEDLVGLVPGGL